jgi:hypothetical protein
MAQNNRKSRALNKDMTFEEIDEQIKLLSTQKSIDIEKAIYSNNPQQILNAQSYLARQEGKKNKPDIKSWLYLPDDYAHTGKGYKDAIKGITFEALKSISKLFVVRLVHDTRIDQIKNFLAFTTDDQKEGFTITKKRGLFETEASELTKSEQKVVTGIVKFLETCGNNSKWDNYDDYIEFISKIMRDSLTYDQLGFENVRSRNGELQKIVSVDASMLRQLDSMDPRYVNQFKDMMWNWEGQEYPPQYCMAYNGQILNHPISGQPIMYYPWQLGYGIRNKVTDVKANGYGVGELEVGIELITWILWSFQYNGNFFKQGSQPKGFLNIKDGNLDNGTINEFRNDWRQMMSGVGNAHKLPVFEGINLEWTDLQMKNRDMEFNEWMEFLLIIFCSLYRIDPTELGFNFGKQSSPFGQDGQKERLDHSKKKGLKPLLVFLSKILNKYIISELDENYELKFTGIDIEDEDAQVELDKKKLDGGMVSMEMMFEKHAGRKFNEKTDTILNQVYQQAQQSKMMGGEEMNQMVDEEAGEQQEPVNAFEEFGKSADTDPFVKDTLGYIEKVFSKE